MSTILSIQSHVAYGHVGNCAAVFPLQRLGHEVMTVNTVQFSNHTDYDTFSGDVFSDDHINRVLTGIYQRQAAENIDAILTGYLGSEALAKTLIQHIHTIKQANPNSLYCCDPVMGDRHTGFFIPKALAETIKQEIIPLADIITPNQFELAFLSGKEINSLADATKACEHLAKKGPNIILVTSLHHDKTPENQLDMLLHTPQGNTQISLPKYQFPIPPSGGGDLCSALFLAKMLETQDPTAALTHTAAALNEVFKLTSEKQTRELQIIAAQDAIVNPTDKIALQNKSA